MKELITILITTGGLGFANVLFIERLGVVDFDEQQSKDKFMWCLMFTALNFGVQSTWHNVLLTIIISILATGLVIFGNMKIENWVRIHLLHKDKGSGANAWDQFWGMVATLPNTVIYIFNEDGTRLLNVGTYATVTRSTNQNCGIVLHKIEATEYDYGDNFTLEELQKWIYEDKYDASFYIDAVNDKQYAAVTFPVLDEAE